MNCGYEPALVHRSAQARANRLAEADADLRAEGRVRFLMDYDDRALEHLAQLRAKHHEGVRIRRATAEELAPAPPAPVFTLALSEGRLPTSQPKFDR